MMSVVLDQPHFSECVHELTSARLRRAYHFGQRLLTQSGYRGIRYGFVFVQASELQENPSQPLLATVERLIAEIFFEADSSWGCSAVGDRRTAFSVMPSGRRGTGSTTR
jgi:hypothetical protein